MKKSIRYAALVMAAAMAMSACSKEAEPTAAETTAAQAETSVAETTAAETTAAETTEATEATEAPTPTPLPPIEDPNIEPPEGYYLVWHDEFDADELDATNWAGEYHRPGWVNNELQTYVVDGENYYVRRRSRYPAFDGHQR